MAKPEIDSDVWDAYYSDDPTLSLQAFEEIVYHYQYLVEGIARKMEIRLPSYIDDQTLISHGQIGLLRAIDKYDPPSGPFSRYASVLVWGAIGDGIRADDFAPRGLRKQQRELEASIKDLQNAGTTSPTNSQIAEHMDTSESIIRSLQYRILKADVTPHDPVLLGTSKEAPSLWAADICREFILWLKKKDEITQKVIALRYWEGLNNKKISDRLGVGSDVVREAHREVLVEVLPFIQELARDD